MKGIGFVKCGCSVIKLRALFQRFCWVAVPWAALRSLNYINREGLEEVV
jgi:hypothetical protein